MVPRYYFKGKHPIASRNKTCVALFLDFDGTLVSIRRNPEECYLSSDINKLLKSILDSKKSVVTVLSGRSLADLKKRLSLRGIFYAGNHGLEISGPGIRFTHKGACLAKPSLDSTFGNLQKEIGGREGVLIENKSFSIALHYRNAPKETIPLIRKLFYSVIVKEPAYAQSFAVMKGKKVLELLPRVSWDKGAAALYIMKKLDEKYLPVCVGDDTTDETLFKAFRETGITIRVGPSRRTAAGFYLKNRREIPLLLQQIDDTLR